MFTLRHRLSETKCIKSRKHGFLSHSRKSVIKLLQFCITHFFHSSYIFPFIVHNESMLLNDEPFLQLVQIKMPLIPPPPIFSAKIKLSLLIWLLRWKRFWPWMWGSCSTKSIDPFFSFFSHSPGEDRLKRVFCAKLCYSLDHFHYYIQNKKQKTKHESGIFCKKRKLSLSQSRANETLRRRHKVN